MRKSRWLWRMIGTVSLVTTVVLSAGFGYAVRTVVFPQGGMPAAVVQETTREQDGIEDSISIVALGDSLTVGFGDATGKGYVRGLREKLEKTADVPVYIVGNFAQNGYTTSQVIKDLRQREGVREAVKRADLVVMTVGGNDLFQPGSEIDVGKIKGEMSGALMNIRGILVKIREINPDAHIYYIGLYNPFIELKNIEGTTEIVQQFNADVFRVAEQFERITLVPTFDLFENDVERFLASDSYHLNEAGYARIADRLAMLLE